MTPITTDDILEAIRLALVDQPDGSESGLTIRELTGKLQGGQCISVDRTRLAVQRLLAEGTMEVVRVRRPRMDGISQVVSAYRLRG